MSILRPAVNVMFLAICSLIAIHSTSCTHQVSLKTGEEELSWQQPMWKNTDTDGVLLEWKVPAGGAAKYRQIQKSIETREGVSSEYEYSVTLKYQVENISKEGAARVLVKGKNLNAGGERGKLMRFMIESSPFLGSFTMSSSGHMTDVSGAVGIRSLPAFSRDIVKIGSKWSAPVAVLIATPLPEAIATGTCTYQLTGLADVNGRKWAKVLFGGGIDLPKKKVAVKKVIGVRWSEKPVEGERGVSVGEVIQDFPAHDAGLLPGDVIMKFDGMAIKSWEDLVFAVALSPENKSVPVEIVRGGEIKKYLVKPKVEAYGQIESKGNIKGTLVFDVTEGILIRMDIDYLSIRNSVKVGEKEIDSKARITVISQLIDEFTRKRPAIAK